MDMDRKRLDERIEKFKTDQKQKENDYLNNIGKEIKVILLDDRKSVQLSFPDGKTHETKLRKEGGEEEISSESNDSDYMD